MKWSAASFGAFLALLLIVGGFIPVGQEGFWARCLVFVVAVVVHSVLLEWRDRARSARGDKS